MKKQFIAGLFLIGLSFCSYAADPIMAKNAWIREAPPGAAVMAAYMTLENSTDTELRLVGADSPAFNTVEIHKTVEEDGVARMIAINELEIPAGGKVELVPGGLHVMLIEPSAKQPQAGEEVSLTLYFSNEHTQTLAIPVQKAASSTSPN